MDFQEALEASHRAWDRLANGDPEPAKAAYSHADDATLANPFGTVATGWKAISEAADYVASRFHEGSFGPVGEVARYESGDFVTLFEIENWNVRVGDRPNVEPFELRVTSTFRREDGTWKIVHRHADPLRTFDADGPLRAT